MGIGECELDRRAEQARREVVADDIRNGTRPADLARDLVLYIEELENQLAYANSQEKSHQSARIHAENNESRSLDRVRELQDNVAFSSRWLFRLSGLMAGSMVGQAICYFIK